MKTLINQLVIFDDEKRTLTPLNHPFTACVLTVSAVRLLALLMSKRGLPVKKNDIIEHVWVSQGFVVTENSLHQAIALLRKSLKESGLAGEIILTAPRIGYSFQGDISSPEPEVTPEIVTTVEPIKPPQQIVTEQTVVIQENIIPQRQTKRVVTLLLTAIAALLWIILFYVYILQEIGSRDPLKNLTAINYEDTGKKIKGRSVLINSRFKNDFNFLNDRITEIQQEPMLSEQFLAENKINTIYINGSNTSNIYGFFLCSGPISDAASYCISSMIIEER